MPLLASCSALFVQSIEKYITLGRQTRPNPDVVSPCDYWRVIITIPFLDSIISELEINLLPTKRHILNFVHLYLRLTENKMCKQRITF